MKKIGLKTYGRKGYFDLPPEYSQFDSARIVIIPWGLEKTTSFGKGTVCGPEAILNASHQVELYDVDRRAEIFREAGGIATLKTNVKNSKSHTRLLEELEEIIGEVLRFKKFPLIIGGEHSLTLAPVRALRKKWGSKLCVLHFDAHSDLRPEYKGDPYSHASAMHLLLPYVKKIVSAGIRDMGSEELPVVKKYKSKINIFWWRKDCYPIRNNLEKCGERICHLLKGNPVYVSFDVDALDPAIIGSSTGTPELGGFLLDEVLDIFESTLPHCNIVGADFVEHSPIRGHHAPDYAIAKLIYKFLGIIFLK